MKILAVGDPHGSKKIFDIKVDKDVDAVFITGDLGQSDLLRKYYFEYFIKKRISKWKDIIPKDELESLYLEFINSSFEVLKYFSSKKPTFFVFGNLREGLPLFEEKIKQLPNLTNIGFKTVEFKGVKIAGVPFFENLEWINEFSPNNESLIETAEKEQPLAEDFLKVLPKVDILLTHIPPYGVLDVVQSEYVPKEWLGMHAGSKLVLNYIKRQKPKLVLCGHIHEAAGKDNIAASEIYNLGSNGDYKILEI